MSTVLRGIVLGAVVTLLLAALVGFLSVRFAWDRLHVRESDVYGVYVAHYQNGTETVTLNRDHTYSQEIEAEFSAEPVRNAGVWTWNPGEREVVMEDCIYPAPGAGFDGHLTIDFAETRGKCRYPVEWWTALIFGPLVLFNHEEYPLKKVE